MCTKLTHAKLENRVTGLAAKLLGFVDFLRNIGEGGHHEGE